MRRVLIDTGPIVALLNRRDEFHQWAIETFAGLEPPVFTCEPVLAESTYLVRRLPGGAQAVLDLIARGVVEIDFRVDSELLALRTLLTRYASVPMSLADACLVRMAELQPGCEVVTLDGDFQVYRRSGRRAIPVISPRRT